MILGISIEQKRKAKRLYKDYLKQLQDELLWHPILEKIVYEKDFNALKYLLSAENQIFLFINNDNIDICKIDVKNEKTENISLLHYQTLLKMFKKERTRYQFTLQTFSIYHHFEKPFDNCILCIKHQSKEKNPIS